MPAPAVSPLDALIEEALAPYRRVWPAHVLEAFREELRITLQTHPAARRLAAEARMGLDGASGEIHVTGAEVHLAGGDVDEGAPARARRAGAR